MARRTHGDENYDEIQNVMLEDLERRGFGPLTQFEIADYTGIPRTTIEYTEMRAVEKLSLLRHDTEWGDILREQYGNGPGK